MKSNKRWFSIKNTLSSASRKPKMALCDDNGGIWKFILKYSVTVHYNRLVLEQWTKRWMTISSSKLQNEQSEVLCLRNRKSFWLRYRVSCKKFYWKHCNLESIVVIWGRV